MTHGMKKSDEAIVAEKSANKGGAILGGADGAKGLTRGENREAKTRAGRRAGEAWTQAAGPDTAVCQNRKPRRRLTALLHHVTVDALREAYGELKRWAAPGVDGMTWKEYAVGLEDRWVDLHDRVQRGGVPGDAIAGG